MYLSQNRIILIEYMRIIQCLKEVMIMQQYSDGIITNTIIIKKHGLRTVVAALFIMCILLLVSSGGCGGSTSGAQDYNAYSGGGIDMLSSPTPLPTPMPTPSPTPSPSPSPSPVFRFVTSDPAFIDYRCGFSPDGATIVFERSPAGGASPDFHLQLVPTAGGTVKPLLTGFTRQSTRPNWSSANNRIAFTASGSDGDTLWIVNPDGSGLINVAPPQFRTIVDYPYWFPDGLTLAVVDYGSNPLTAYKGIIRRVGIPPAPVTVVDLTSDTQVLAGMPSVSPDGRYVVLAAQANVNAPYDQNTNSIYVADLQAPSGTPPMLFDSGQGRAPSWSPNGRIINFESNRGSQNSNIYAIYMKPFTGTDNDVNVKAAQFTDSTLNAQHAVWSRDGSLVVMSALLPNPPAGTAPRGILVMSAPSQ
jgi:Tol biopolymer transport system component